MQSRTFLSAEWRYLAMLNFAVEPKVLKPFIPAGTELDFYHDVTFVSIVGFRFLNTRVMGCGFPFHRDFDEVNLRFYVRQQTVGNWRRGVVFIKEMVPRRAIAFLARTVYGEPYCSLPMRHKIDAGDLETNVEYSWLRAGKWESLALRSKGPALRIEQGSQEEFITEHYWGFTKIPSGCKAYEVVHPRWRVWPASESCFEADVSALYGEQFKDSLTGRPKSAFIADGSSVFVKFNS